MDSIALRIIRSVVLLFLAVMIITFDGVTTIGGIFGVGLLTGAGIVMNLSRRAF